MGYSYHNKHYFEDRVYVSNIDKMNDAADYAGATTNIDLDTIECKFIWMTKELRETTREEAYFCVVDPGVISERGDKLYITLQKQEDGDFCGYFVHSFFAFARKQMNKCIIRHSDLTEILVEFKNKYETNAPAIPMPKVTVEKPKPTSDLSKVTVSKDLVKQITERLLFNGFTTGNGFNRYLLIVGSRAYQIVNRGTDYSRTIITDENKSKLIVNTGLLDKFGRDILLMYRIHLGAKTYEPYKIIECKNDYVEEGFPKESFIDDLKPISFIDEADRNLVITMKDVDISYSNLLHIIEERHDRYPESVVNTPPSILAQKIMSALDLSIKMQERDATYIKPSYSGKSRQISWLVPLHIETEMDKDPELVIVLVKNGDYFSPKTVYPYDAGVKDRITAMSIYSGISW